jgi:hypothetical protein
MAVLDGESRGVRGRAEVGAGGGADEDARAAHKHNGAFADLRKLSDWFSTSPQRSSLHIERMVRRLGATAVPMLGRELTSSDVRRREAARDCLLLVAAEVRERVLVELRAIIAGERAGERAKADEVKVCTLGLLAELGEHAAAQLDDPSAMQRRSALALGAQLETAADVASAADMMIGKLDTAAIVQMVEALSEAAPEAAQRLATELVGRLDLDAEVREYISAQEYAAPAKPKTLESIAAAKRTPRPTHVAVLVNQQARFVVVASRKLSGERRWRRWAVLIGTAGQIEDCLHEEAVPRTPNGEDADAAPLIANLVADGYRVVADRGTDLDHARAVVAAAARLTASRPDPRGLTSAYYLGRDLLDLGDAHLGPRRTQTPALARAIELLADGDATRALALLVEQPSDGPDHAATIAACALAQGRHADAVEPLGKAIAAEPAWPLHHWNLAVACHALGDHAGTYHALRRFVATSARPTALLGDPDQPARVAFATHRVAELERAARLAGRSLSRRKRARRTTAKSSKTTSSG